MVRVNLKLKRLEIRHTFTEKYRYANGELRPLLTPVFINEYDDEFVVIATKKNLVTLAKHIIDHFEHEPLEKFINGQAGQYI